MGQGSQLITKKKNEMNPQNPIKLKKASMTYAKLKLKKFQGVCIKPF